MKKPKKLGLGSEISFALVLKLALLFVLWMLCFSHPQTTHINRNTLSRHFFGTTITIGNTSNDVAN
ncbi:MAG: cytochrome oxidase putative small subunit CydP [Pseudomonadota bacterium]